MNFGSLFSFQGRQRRLHFWLIGIAIGVINGIVINICVMPVMMATAQGVAPPAGAAVLQIVGWVVYLALLWPSLANSVKRCHDRDKSGWFLLLYGLVSLTIIGALWPLIELGFLDGTPGPNKFGPSPKGIAGPANSLGAPPAAPVAS